MSETRKLVAILVADVVGDSRLVARVNLIMVWLVKRPRCHPMTPPSLKLK
jgi:hypothetical protein